MSLLDQLEVTDNINSAKSVSDMSTDVVDTLEPYMSWYDYVNGDSNYTHILAICINEKFYDHWTLDWITLMKMIMYTADANFISHSDANVVVVYNPKTFISKLNSFIKEPPYCLGGPVLKDSYGNGLIRIKIAVEMSKTNCTTKFLDFMLSVRTLFEKFSMAPVDGEFVEVYRREQNKVWRTTKSEAFNDILKNYGHAILYNESNALYFYKFVDNSKNCIFTEEKTNTCSSELPEPPVSEMYDMLLKRIICNKMLDSGSSVSRQVDVWFKRADKFYLRLKKEQGHSEKEEITFRLSSKRNNFVTLIAVAAMFLLIIILSRLLA